MFCVFLPENFFQIRSGSNLPLLNGVKVDRLLVSNLFFRFPSEIYTLLIDPAFSNVVSFVKKALTMNCF